MSDGLGISSTWLGGARKHAVTSTYIKHISVPRYNKEERGDKFHNNKEEIGELKEQDHHDKFHDNKEERTEGNRTIMTTFIITKRTEDN
jgi:hypothetical protein